MASGRAGLSSRRPGRLIAQSSSVGGDPRPVVNPVGPDRSRQCSLRPGRLVGSPLAFGSRPGPTDNGAATRTAFRFNRLVDRSASGTPKSTGLPRLPPEGDGRDSARRSVSRPSALRVSGRFVLGSSARRAATTMESSENHRPSRPVLVTGRGGGTVRLAQAGFEAFVNGCMGNASSTTVSPRWFRPRACSIILIEPARPAGARLSGLASVTAAGLWPVGSEARRFRTGLPVSSLLNSSPLDPGGPKQLRSSSLSHLYLISSRLFSVAGIGRVCRRRPAERQHLRPFWPVVFASRHDRYRPLDSSRGAHEKAPGRSSGGFDRCRRVRRLADSAQTSCFFRPTSVRIRSASRAVSNGLRNVSVKIERSNPLALSSSDSSPTMTVSA